MMRRLIGLLMILALLLPLLIGAAAVLTLSDVLARVQATSDFRLAQLQGKLDALELTVNTATNRYDVLKSVTDQVRVAAQVASMDAATINDLRVSGAAPAVLDLGALREHLSNLYNALDSLSSALYDSTVINQIPGQLGEAISETQGLYSDVNNIFASYGQIFLLIGVALLVWMALVYIILIYRWGRRGWALLSGQVGETKTAGGIPAAP